MSPLKTKFSLAGPRREARDVKFVVICRPAIEKYTAPQAPFSTGKLAASRAGFRKHGVQGSRPQCVSQGWCCPHKLLMRNSAHTQHLMLFPVY